MHFPLPLIRPRFHSSPFRNVDRLDAALYKEDRAHNGVINDVDAVGGDGTGAVEVVSACSDGSVRVWDPRQTQFPVARFEPKTDDANSVLYPCMAARFGNAFDGTERCVAAGYDNGDVKLFDLRSMKIRWQTHISSSVCSLEFDDKSSPLNRLTVGTSAGRVHAFNLAAESAGAQTDVPLSDRLAEPIWCVRHLPQSPTTVAATGNGAVHLFNLRLFSARISILRSRKFNQTNSVSASTPRCIRRENSKSETIRSTASPGMRSGRGSPFADPSAKR